MSAEVRYEVGGYLAEQLDAFEALIEQRDRARAELAVVETERDDLILRLERALAPLERALADLSVLRDRGQS